MADANGGPLLLPPEVPAPEALIDASTADNVAVEEATEPFREPRGIYMLRVPRPAFDDAPLKKADADLSTCISKLKAINGKAQIKRGEANELRKQLGVARSLRNGSSPEFDEKIARRKQLADMRNTLLERIRELKSGRAGLEVRTEEELDERVAEMEHAIQHDGLTLAVEKQYVRSIAKLRAQRDKVRELQGQSGDLQQLEAEAKKIKAVIDEVDSEVNILRGERDQAKDIIDDLQAKLSVVMGALADFDAERQDVESTKRELQEQIRVQREEIDAHMFEWRANRKLSLQLRDLVTEGKLEEATSLAEQQVQSYLTKLLVDSSYRHEYTRLWAEQRRYVVSELLPDSAPADVRPPTGSGATGKDGKAGASGRDRSGKPSAPLVPQGAAKAQALIAAALEEANAAIAAKRAAEPAAQHVQPADSGDGDAAGDDDEDGAAESAAAPVEPATRAVVPGATEEMSAAPRVQKQSKHAFDYAKAMCEVPEVPDYEYLLPTSAPKSDAAHGDLSAADIKARIREEQRIKALEAEARKKRRQEQLARKTAAAAAARHRAAEQAAVSAAVAAAAGRSARADLSSASYAQPGAGEASDDAVALPAQRVGSGHPSRTVKVQQPTLARKPVPKRTPRPLKWYQQLQQRPELLAVGGVTLLFALLLLIWATTR